MRSIHKNKSLLSQTIVIAVALLFASCGEKQKGDMTINGQHADEKSDIANKERDAHFFVYAAEFNLGQIQMGQLAQKNSEMTDVRELGRMIEASHTKSLDELIEVAKKKLITIPTITTNYSKAIYLKLSGRKKADFDKEYCDLMVSEYESAINIFEQNFAESSDADTKKWIIKSLAELRANQKNVISCRANCLKYSSN